METLFVSVWLKCIFGNELIVYSLESKLSWSDGYELDLALLEVSLKCTLFSTQLKSCDVQRGPPIL